jgi:hypothetical protein
MNLIFSNLPVDLLRAEAVLVHRDGHVPPLAPLYDGPYRVLTRSRDFFRLQMGDRHGFHQPPQALPRPCCSPSYTTTSRTSPWSAEVRHLLLAACGDAAGPFGRAAACFCFFGRAC